MKLAQKSQWRGFISIGILTIIASIALLSGGIGYGTYKYHKLATETERLQAQLEEADQTATTSTDYPPAQSEHSSLTEGTATTSLVHNVDGIEIDTSRPTEVVHTAPIDTTPSTAPSEIVKAENNVAVTTTETEINIATTAADTVSSDDTVSTTNEPDSIDWSYWDDQLQSLQSTKTEWFHTLREYEDSIEDYENHRSDFITYSNAAEGTVAEDLGKQGYNLFSELIDIREDRILLLEELTSTFSDFKKSIENRDESNFLYLEPKLTDLVAEYNSTIADNDDLYEEAIDLYGEYYDALKALGVFDYYYLY